MYAWNRSVFSHLFLESLEKRIVPTTATLTDRVLNILGTPGADNIQIDQSNKIISVSGVASSFEANRIDLISIEAGAGDDFVSIGQSVVEKTWVFGNSGNDRISAGGGDTTIYGGSGNDTLVGGAGTDVLDGGTGTDSLSAQIGDHVSQDTADAGEPLSQIAQQVVQLTNDYRVAHGRLPLQATTQLAAMADLQARNMVSMVPVVGYNAAMSHLLYGVPQTTLASRADYVGFDALTLGENIAFGYGTADAVFQAWISSSGHRANILNPSFTQTGVSARYTAQGIPYFAQEFGSASASILVGPPTATPSTPAASFSLPSSSQSSNDSPPAKPTPKDQPPNSIILSQAFGAGSEQTGQVYAVGSGAGPTANVTVYDMASGAIMFRVQPYGGAFRGGVHVAVCDITGDGVQDVIVAPGAGISPLVKIYEGATGRLFKSFYAYSPYWRGGVNVAVGDVNGDGRSDVVTGAEAGGGPNVKAFDGRSLLAFRNFMAYDSRFRGGVRVAVADTNGDGKAEIITAPAAGMSAVIKIFSDATGKLTSSFTAYDAAWTGGAYVAAGDLDGDGRAEIVTGADAGGIAHVKAFNALNFSIVASFASDANFNGGVRVAVRDIDGDGKAEIITAQGRGGNRVRLFWGDGKDMLTSFLAGDLNNPSGVYVG